MKRITLFVCLFLILAFPLRAQELYEHAGGVNTRWASGENPRGEKGQGGLENRGAKGHAFDILPAGQSLTLLDVQGAGIVRRMWVTLNDRSPEMLRALRLDMYWDGASKPAVSVPFGDFFNAGLGMLVPFENALFASPEGRSFVFFVPMPFRSGARIVLTNEASRDLGLVFYDVNYTLGDDLDEDVLYFHAYWNRNPATELGRDFEILPALNGKGRFLGMHVGVRTDSSYSNTWWGEGEVKMFLDGDVDTPTLVGTGTEDYIGTGWGQGAYINRYQGAPIADPENRRWTFYRYHIPDPVFFNSGIRVTLQQMGGAPKDQVLEMIAAGVNLQPVSIDAGGRPNFIKLLERDPVPSLDDPGLPDGWVNFYRSDDVSSVALFYLASPTSNLPPLQPVAERVAGL